MPVIQTPDKEKKANQAVADRARQTSALDAAIAKRDTISVTQPLSDILTALAALDGVTGFLIQTGAATFIKRTMSAPGVGLVLTDPDGVGGNPTFALANDLAALEGLGGTGIAVRTAADTWAMRLLSAPAEGLAITNPGGVAGNLIFALANDLAALEALASTGFAVRTAADTWAQRSLTSSSNNLSITNPAGVGGNPVLDLAVGQLLIGTWTPTLTGVANVDATTSGVCFYARIGTLVLCCGSINVDPTAAANTNTQVGITLPVASNLGASTDLQGLCCTQVSQRGGRVNGDAVNDRANMAFASETTANTTFSFVFFYTII